MMRELQTLIERFAFWEIEDYDVRITSDGVTIGWAFQTYDDTLVLHRYCSSDDVRDGLLSAIETLGFPIVEAEIVDDEIVADPVAVEEQTRDVPWSCDDCDFVGKNQHSLSMHRARKHKPPKVKLGDLGQYPCSCGKKFVTRRELAVHARDVNHVMLDGARPVGS